MRPMRSRPVLSLRLHAAWLLLFAPCAAWPFRGPLLEHRMLYFRDISVTYYPDLVFLARALHQGVWPLWHPGADAGAPFLTVYPVHLLLAWLVGPAVTLAVSPFLHVLLAMAGAGALAGRAGCGPWGRWTSGAVYGLSGYLLGSVLYPVFLAAAWAPLTAALLLDTLEAPTLRRAAALAVAGALLLSTLGVEVVPQVVILVLLLTPGMPGRRAVGALALAATLILLLAAPVLAGSLWLLRGTARGAGFAPDVALSYSAPLPVLLESVFPRFLGDPHTFSDLGFWGQPFYPAGSPFFLSFYLGPVVLLLALRAGRREWRLWLLGLLGVLLAAGSYGPLARALAVVMHDTRVPAKFFLLTTTAVALLAGRGVERARREGWSFAAAIPGVVLLSASLLAWRTPSQLARAVSLAIPAARGPLAAYVIAGQWPAQLALAGCLTLGASLAMRRGGRFVIVAAALAVLDLARVNGPLNPSAPAAFYDLEPPVHRVVERARGEGRFRWFSFGAAQAGPLTWRPEIVRRNDDVWLYYLDRQSLVPRTQVLDGLEGAFDVDRMGLAPLGATLSPQESQPRFLGSYVGRLRDANVRWVVSFAPLPENLVALYAEVPLPEVAEPLRLYELKQWLPRAYYVARLEDAEAGGDPFAPRTQVGYESPDPETVVLHCRTPPGFIVVRDGYHPDWTAEDDRGPVPILRVDGRYRAVPTPGGERTFALHLHPPWRGPALAAAALGLCLVVSLCFVPAGRSSRGPTAC